MKIFPDFETIIRAIDPRLTVEQNPNRKEVANVKINGTDICSIPSGEIFEKTDKSYGYVAPNGYKLVHPCIEDILGRVKDTIKRLDTDNKFNEDFFDK